MKSEKVRKNLNPILVYTLFFMIVAYFSYTVFGENGKSFIWNSDGFYQHFPIMLELRENVRTIIKSGFREIPLWNWDVGLGFNLISTYSYDLFYWLIVLLPEHLLVTGYALLIILKLYLSGLFLMLYLKQIKIEGTPAVVGALVYAFCGYALFAGVRHPFFISPMVIFPLIMWGIERVLQGKGSNLLVGAVFLATINHYYFLYMMAVGAVIYSVFRCLGLEKKEYIRSIFNIGLKSALGVLLGVFLLLPNILFFLNSNRTSTDLNINLFYNKSYYRNFITSFATAGNTGKWTVLMFASIVLVTLPLLFTRHFKKYAYMRYIFVTMTGMLMFPKIGSIMNGFSNVSNRWVFMYAFFVSCIVAIGLSIIKELQRTEYIYIGLGLCGYLLLEVLVKGLNTKTIIPILFGMMMTMLCLLWSQQIKPRRIVEWALIGLVSFNIIYIARDYYIGEEVEYVSEFTDNKNIIEKYRKNSQIIIDNVDDEGLYRVDQNYYGKNNVYKNSVVSNDGFVSNVNNSAQFISGINNHLWQFSLEQNLVELRHLNCILGYDDRSVLESFLAMKYKILKDEKDYLGMGYQLIAEQDGYKLYENLNALNIGTFYSGYISKEDYINLAPVDRAMALLQGVVVEDEVIAEHSQIGQLERVEPKAYSQELEYRVIKSEGIEVSEKQIVVKQKDAELILEVDVPSQTELYFSIEGLKKKQSAKKSIYVSTEGVEKQIVLSKSDDIYDTQQEDYLVNLGYLEENKTQTIKLRFADKATYTMDAMSVISVDMTDYQKYIDALKAEELQDITYTSHSVSGTINATGDGVMVFTIPYEKGWSAKVDGKKVDIVQVSTGFIGVPIEVGEHVITLSYVPAGLKIGVFISGATAILLLIGSLYSRKKKNDSDGARDVDEVEYE